MSAAKETSASTEQSPLNPPQRKRRRIASSINKPQSNEEINSDNHENLSELDPHTIKERLRQNFFKWYQDEELKNSYIHSLCRNCADGKCTEAQEGWEDAHHKDIERAVFTNEKDQTIYFLNNIKSMPGSQFNFSMNAYHGSHPEPLLSCYACKAISKSIITQGNALKKILQANACFIASAYTAK
eukprot:65051_1